MDKEIAAAMATQDIMNAVLSLSQMNPELLDSEHDDLELAYAKLGRLLFDNELRRLRQRSGAHAQTLSASMALSEIPAAGKS